MAQLDLTFFKRPCTHTYNRAESCSKGGQGWVKKLQSSSELVWGQRPKFSYSLPQAAFCEPLARGLTQLSTSSRACMKTLKQICKGLKSSTKTVHQFSLSLRGDGPCPSQGLVPCVGRHCVPQRTAKQTLNNLDHHSHWMTHSRGGVVPPCEAI